MVIFDSSPQTPKEKERYPIPPDALIEPFNGFNLEDHHVLVLDRSNCILYELFSASPQPDGSWHAGSGAIYDLNSNALRPNGLRSADPAGLPILPGLLRYEEVAAGEIRHALRFTMPETCNNYLWPARHTTSDLEFDDLPPYGQRFRLKASFDISPFSAPVRVILQAMKTYGLILADLGQPWYISGVPHPQWDTSMLVSELKQVKASDFEAVDVSSLMADPESGLAVQSADGGSTGGGSGNGGCFISALLGDGG